MTIARAIHPVPSAPWGLSPPGLSAKGECGTSQAHHNEDTIGLYEAVLFPKVFHRFCHMLSSSRPSILEGRLEKEFGSITLTVDWLGFLDRYKREVPRPRRENKMTIKAVRLVSG